MKQITLVILAILTTFSVYAQTQDVLTSKKGYPILPQAGDYALGFDAVPLLDFALNAVNIMNNTGQTAAHPGFVSGFNNVLVGKYFVSETMAYRARLGINTFNNSIKTYGNDPLNPSSPDPENVLLTTTTNTTRSTILGGGIEFRRGHNRLQGYYGGEALLGFGSSSTKNKYGIAYDQTAQDSGYIGAFASRVLVAKTGTSVLFGLRGFVGVEYFILPKISIGAEFGWGLGMNITPRGSVETEYWGIEPGSTATAPAQYIDVVKGNSSSFAWGFGVDSGISQVLAPSAALTMLFHF